MSEDLLRDLARRVGIAVEWQDYAGKPQIVPAAVLRRVLAALGLPADTSRELSASRRLLTKRRSLADLDRNGYLEETFFTFSFSPIRDETGGVGGLFHPVTETTSEVLSERRTRNAGSSGGAGRTRCDDSDWRDRPRTRATRARNLR